MTDSTFVLSYYKVGIISGNTLIVLGLERLRVKACVIWLVHLFVAGDGGWTCNIFILVFPWGDHNGRKLKCVYMQWLPVYNLTGSWLSRLISDERLCVG